MIFHIFLLVYPRVSPLISLEGSPAYCQVGHQQGAEPRV